MAEEIAAKRLIFRELLRLIGQTLPPTEGLVMASLGGEGMEPELQAVLSQEREDRARVWFIERDFIRAEGLKRFFPDARFYHGPATRLRDEFVRTRDTSLHLVHWDLAGMRPANVQLMAATLPFLWRSETRLLAVTLDDRFFSPPWADVGGIVKMVEGLFEESRVNWRILLDLYGEGGPGFTPSDGYDPRWIALRELATLLCVVFAPLASAAVRVKGQDLAPLELLSRLGGHGSRPGWFMENAKQSMVFLPGELTRYQALTDNGTMLRTYVFRYVRQSSEVWDSIRGWEWLFRSPLIRLTEQGPNVLRGLQTYFVRPPPAAIEVEDLLPVPPKPSSAPTLVDEEPDESTALEALCSEPEPIPPPASDHGAAVPGLKEIASQQGTRIEKIEEIRKMARTIPRKPPATEEKKAAPVKKTEADHAYDRLLPIKDMISPLLWQNIESLYAEAKRERRPNHSKRIATLEGLVKTSESLIAELREEQGETGAAPKAKPPTSARPTAAPAKRATKPKPTGMNGKGNGADLEQKLLEALQGKGKLRSEQISAVLGTKVDSDVLRNTLKQLREQGKIKIEGKRRGTTYHVVA